MCEPVARIDQVTHVILAALPLADTMPAKTLGMIPGMVAELNR